MNQEPEVTHFLSYQKECGRCYPSIVKVWPEASYYIGYCCNNFQPKNHEFPSWGTTCAEYENQKEEFALINLVRIHRFWTEMEGWQELCDTLGLEIPSRPPTKIKKLAEKPWEAITLEASLNAIYNTLLSVDERFDCRLLISASSSVTLIRQKRPRTLPTKKAFSISDA